MSNPTTPFGWQMPTATDLVTDLPADFEVFGQAVATSMADLLGGTSGQILAKNSNTDMDFVWITNDVGDITAVTAGTGISGGGTSGAVTITNSMATAIDAKGDLIAGTGADAFSRLAAGANGTVLTADSAEATGLKWATAASGALTKITSNTFSAVTSVSLPTSTFTSTYANYKVVFIVTASSVGPAINGRFRASGTDNTTASYTQANQMFYSNANTTTVNNSQLATAYTLGYINSANQGTFALTLDFLSPQLSAKKHLLGNGFGSAGGGVNTPTAYSIGAWFDGTTAFDAFSFISSSGTITGSYYVYGYQN